jgi:hypothetical protein
MEIDMSSAHADIAYLLAGRGLVFLPESGFTLASEARARRAHHHEGGDRSYWIAYDYFEDARERRAARRAEMRAALRAYASRMLASVTRPGKDTAYTEHVAA